jgi:hypothetical protein
VRSTPEQLDRGDRLPEITLAAAGDGGEFVLRPRNRQALVVLTLHGGECGECARALSDLMASAAEMREWDGHVIAVVAGERVPAGIRAAQRDGCVVVSDAGRALTTRGIPTPAVLIADQWGELALVHDAGESHDFPTPDEIVEWLRFLAIQCPECQGEAL